MQVPPPARSSLGRPWWAVDYASLDFEATGLDFEKDRIISFGVVPIRQGRVEVADVWFRYPAAAEVSIASLESDASRSLGTEPSDWDACLKK